MNSLKEDYHIWLNRYYESEDFCCTATQKGCATYHILSPVLHEIDFLSSYKSYKILIAKILSDAFYRMQYLKILVVGIDSEASARHLINALKLYEGKYSILFIDRCLTPLNRITRCLEQHEKSFIFTDNIDVFDSATIKLSSKFDVIFLDSFVKQFDEGNKPVVLNRIKHFLNPADGVIIIREYFGDLDFLLKSSWEKAANMLDKANLGLFASATEMVNFHLMFNNLIQDYYNSGSIYPYPEKLRSDLEKCNLRIKDEYENKWSTDRIFVVNKSA